MIWWCRQKDKPCSMANENGYCQITACCNTSKPTVKAIPIEWINDWLNKGRNAKYFIPMMEMIKEWEKENETN